MPEPNPNRPADRNLLFGILALQMDFITRDALIKAMNAWVLEKARPLGHILQEHGALREDARALLEALVQKHLEMHGDDAHASLAAVSSVGSVRQELEQVADPDLHASLAHVSMARKEEEDPYASRAASVGTPTSSGLRFRVLRPHAKGGLGQVSVALDEELHREVALKEIQDRYADDPHSRTRFVLEAEVTGGLEHPGIVPVYGLGCYDDGRPFYAMRFIRGDSLQDAIAKFHQAEGPKRDPGERALALRGLLGRFVAVCNAIAYAHARGVLHRDLKPGNVMLGKYGETLVVDWGLAKVMGRGQLPTEPPEPYLVLSSADSGAPTQMGSALGTPQFMSPEQAAGRLDLLGPASDVYSLGATLYHLLTGKAPFEGADAGAILQKVQQGEFPAPRRVSRAVAAALEAVCLKAMALRPEERYASARALADDVEHWLADEPVTAYREPLLRRVGRWRRRHPATTATLLVTLLLAGGGWLWLEWDRQGRREETGRRLNLALGKAEQLRDQARKIALDEPARAEVAVALWKQGLAAVEEAEGVLATGLADETLRREVGALRGELEKAAGAAAATLAQLRKNAKLRADTENAPLLALLTQDGRLDYRSADEAFARAFREYGMDIRASSPEAVERWLRQCPAHMVEPLVVALNDWEQYAVSAKERERLRQVLRRVDQDPWRQQLRDALVRKDAARLRALAAEAKGKSLPAPVLADLGQALLRQKETALAVDLLRRAQSAYPADFRVHFSLGASLVALKAGRPASLEEAVGCMRAALARRPETSFAHSSLAHVLLEKKDVAGAIAACRKAIALDPNYAPAHNELGTALADKKDVAGAIAAFRKAIALDPNLAGVHSNLGIALADKKDLVGAIAAYRKAIHLDPNFAGAHHGLGNALREKQDLAGAIAAYRKAIHLDPDYAPAHSSLGAALHVKKDVAGAIAAYRKAIELDPKLPQAHYNLGAALREKKDLAGAIAACRRAIALDPNLAPAYSNLGIALYEKKDLAGAIAAYRKAIELEPKYTRDHYNIGLALRDKGHFTESLASFRRFHTLASGHPAWKELAAKAVREAEQLVALESKLTAVLKGEAQPTDAAEGVLLAGVCQQEYKRLYTASARLYAAAFAADPKLQDVENTSHRYNAACAATLAAAGEGEDAAKLTDKERSRWRQQALDWLRADLALCVKLAGDGSAKTKVQLQTTLQHWQRDTDLASVRDEAALARLPETERTAWQQLWTDVAATLKKARGVGKSAK